MLERENVAPYAPALQWHPHPPLPLSRRLLAKGAGAGGWSALPPPRPGETGKWQLTHTCAAGMLRATSECGSYPEWWRVTGPLKPGNPRRKLFPTQWCQLLPPAFSFRKGGGDEIRESTGESRHRACHGGVCLFPTPQKRRRGTRLREHAHSESGHGGSLMLHIPAWYARRATGQTTPCSSCKQG